MANMKLHAFVAMPYGTKDGIDFNAVYGRYVKPALESAGFTVFRADEEQRAGEIRKDMFQELLLADLVVVDLTIDNPNVWYELGVRHALRARGVLQILTRRERVPFDIVTDRVLRYHEKNGVPDPTYLEEDKKGLAAFATETMKAWYGWKVSPVYQLLPFLEEPNWKKLKVADAQIWEQYREWERRIESARRFNRAGDILVLSEEAPTYVLRLEAKRMAGKALLKLGSYRLALEQFEQALHIDPTDLDSRLQKGVLLGRLGQHKKAREWVDAVLEVHKNDPESWALVGRVEKEEWISRWRIKDTSTAEMRALAAHEQALLQEAVQPYQTAFIQDPSHYYSGINAVTLHHLERHLGGHIKDPNKLAAVEGGVAWACQSALAKNLKDYWARVTLADLSLLLADMDEVVRRYRHAVAAADNDWFALDSVRQQLRLLADLEFRPDLVAAALKVVEEEIRRAEAPLKPRYVFLFSGHMVDKPGREAPRFPKEMEGCAAEKIAETLAKLGAGPEDLSISSGACGGDILFGEAVLARNVPLRLFLPLPESEFLDASVNFAGGAWRDRFYSLRENRLTKTSVMPDELGPTPGGMRHFARCNLWQLYTALAYGTEKVRLIALWNGQKGDGPGGTEHMVDTVRRHLGRVEILDARVLFEVSG